LPGHGDIELYFDKETGLPVRTVRPGRDPAIDAKGQVTRFEFLYSNPKEMAGVKMASKVVFNLERKGRFVKFWEYEIVEVKPLSNVDDKEFARP